MAKLHHKVLESAVNKYGILFTDGMTEDEFKLILKADEKEWSDDQVNEIVAAVNPDTKSKDKVVKAKDKIEIEYVVVTEFRDRNDFNKIHKVDDNFISSDTELIASLLKRELIE